ncbi:ATP-binding cassette domain-containing protein [Nakamurella sp. YIM 132087]|uniref:ATP-binding cassette domain-containing protein n=2 Tax=Nakamurella alba TaxID=2665158 RepID=A0A7K1FUW5_9ACTN|nr:ATP-binding cassette domain-containing protein [Nakamurella alba]
MSVARSAFTVDVALDVAPGRTLALLGPNGAGKSTVLSVIAGLLVPDRGHVLVAGRTLTEVRPDGSVAAAVSPQQRQIGLMGQQPLLFPHLTALENIAFGPRSQGRGRVQARRQAETWLEVLGLAQFARRKPRQLSGGQAQRVALARALAAGPDLLLLDEPLGALDAATAPEVRQVLRTHLREQGTTAVLVTHDLLDAAVLADDAVVLERGEVTDSGPVARVLQAPRSVFGAALAGLDLVEGTASESVGSGEVVQVRAGNGSVVSGLASEPVAAGESVVAVFAPSAVAVHREQPGGSPRNAWPAVVRAVQAVGGTVRVDTSGGPASIAADLTPAAVAELELVSGLPVVLAVKATEIAVHPR